MLYLCYRIKLKPILTILLIALLLACNKPAISVEKPDYYYVLKGNENNDYEVKGDTTSPVIAKMYYGQYNFILSGDSSIYLYKRLLGLKCGNGLDFVDRKKPDHIFLVPESLDKLTICQADYLLNWAITEKPVYGRYDLIISIASTTDTIRNHGYAVIKNCIEHNLLKGSKLLWFQRRLTEQERIVLDYKISNKPYTEDNIDWKEEFSYEITEPPIED